MNDIVAAETPFSNLIAMGIYVGVALLALIIIGVIIARLYQRASKEIAFVRTGFGGEKVVINGGALVLPVLHETMPVNMNTVRLAVERKNADALITLDRLRIDVKAEFYVRVRPDREAIAVAAQTLGMRTMQSEHLKELVEGKFVDALRSVAAGMTMNQLHEQRSEFVQKVQQVSSADLAMNGLELESVSLTGLDQTSIEHFNANNAFDAEGLTKLTEQIQLRNKARNDIEQDTRIQIETKNLDAERQSLLIARDNEFAKLEQERELEVRRAEQIAEVARRQADSEREAQEARISAKQQVDSAQIEADRTVEQARIAQAQSLEISRQEQQIAIQNKSREESQAKAEAEAEKLRAEGARARFEVEAAGQRAINEAANLLSSDQISLQTKLALLKVLPEVIREAAKPMEAIESIKIVQVEGLAGTAAGGGTGEAAGNDNLASSAVSAALRYRAQAPVIDSLMKDLGFNGTSLETIVAGAADSAGVTPVKPTENPPHAQTEQ